MVLRLLASEAHWKAKYDALHTETAAISGALITTAQREAHARAERDALRDALGELVAAMRTNNVIRVDDAIKAADRALASATPEGDTPDAQA